MADRADPSPGASPWTEGLRGLREMTEQMAAAAQALAVAGARASPRALSRPLARYSEQLLAVSTAITDPLRRLIEEQQRLVEMMAEWAEQHRRLSEQVAQWAEQQQELSEHMIQLARPFLDQSTMLERLHAAWSGTSSGESDDGEAR